MNTEDLDSLWNAQRPATEFRRPDPAELARQLAPELRRRSRLLGYEIFCLVLALVLTPVLALANARYAAPAHPTLYWLRVTLFLAAVSVALVFALRRLRRHRALAKTKADTLAGAATRALAVVEAEMHDYRVGLRSAPAWLALLLLSMYANAPAGQALWVFMLPRVSVLAFFLLVMGAVCWRHYRKHLVPELARRKELVGQLS
jgi:hypothetical protein